MSRKDKGAEEEQYSNWCNLPPLFISSLLYYLSPKTRFTFRATCRSWNDARLLLPVPVGSSSSPCHSSPVLIRTESIYAGLETTSYECYYPMTGECFWLSTFQNRCRDAVVHSSNFGWLLLSVSLGHPLLLARFFYFNPFTKHIIDHGIDVGASPSEELFSALCFASPPTSSNRQVLSGMYLESYHPFGGDFTVTRDGRLHFMGLPEVLRNQHLSPHNSIVFHRGLYYCLVGAGVVGVSVFEDDDADYTFHDTELFECGTKLRHSFLIEVDGKLLGIFDYQGIRVLWLDIRKWKWDPVGDEDLRDKILYVSYKGSYVQCDDTTKGIGNKIYFPTIIDGGGVYYSLDTRKYHTLSCELEEIEDYGDSMTWIAPTTDGSKVLYTTNNSLCI